MPLFGDLLVGGAGALGFGSQMESLNNQKQESRRTLNETNTQINDNMEFQPYGVTGSLGTTRAGVNGMTMNMSEGASQIQNQMLGAGREQIMASAQDPYARQNQLYGQMQQAQSPEQERQLAMMNARMQAGGRGNMTSAMYGGTPEQLAYQKAVQEQQSANWLGAGTAAEAQLMNQYERGTGMMQQGYAPQEMLMKQGAMAYEGGKIANTMSQQKSGMLADFALGGLTTQNNIENMKNSAIANFAQSQTGNLQAIGDAIDPITGKIWEGVGTWWEETFG